MDDRKTTCLPAERDPAPVSGGTLFYTPGTGLYPAGSGAATETLRWVPGNRDRTPSGGESPDLKD